MLDKDYGILLRSPLFAGISEEELGSMLTCLSAEKKACRKNEYLLRQGDTVDFVGLVLTGSVNVLKDDYWGNRNIVAVIPPGHTFAESYACVPGAPLSVSAQATQETLILRMNIHRVLTTCPSACAFHARLIENLIALLASKNLLMNEKLTYLSQRTTREKLLSYLSASSQRAGNAHFVIPFDRQELADFLSVDRSALSAELSRMQRDGILTYHKNEFTLLSLPEEE